MSQNPLEVRDLNIVVMSHVVGLIPFMRFVVNPTALIVLAHIESVAVVYRLKLENIIPS